MSDKKMKIEEYIAAHQKDLKMVQKVAIICVMLAFITGLFIGIIVMSD